MTRTAVYLVLILVVEGCLGTTDTPRSELTYYEHVKPIIDENCIGCHQAGGLAPFALDHHAGVDQFREAIAFNVANRLMPPWGADSAAVQYEYKNDNSLTDEQVNVIVDWALNAGQPGDPGNEPEHGTHVLAELDRVDLELRIPEPYTPEQSPDDYHCFVFDWPEETTVYVTGMDADPDVVEQAHHIAVYLIPPDGLADLQDAVGLVEQYDADDPGIGYTCYGGPAGENDQIPALQLGQWVPGMGSGDFPAGTGIQVRPGSKVVLQMHYNTTSINPQPDRTAVRFKVTDSVEHQASFAPWLDVSWPTFRNMDIPAGESPVTHIAQGEPEGFFSTFAPDVTTENGFEIYSILLHLHALGKSGEVKIIRADGTEDLLLWVPDWDFGWQFVYTFATPVRFYPGDKLYVACTWDNSPGNQPIVDGIQKEPIDVNWGEGTDDEMCVANLYISAPRGG